MRVEFEFDRQKVEDLGHTVDEVYDLVKERFTERGLVCVSENEILAFRDQGGKEDFSAMWVLIVRIINSGWFLQCASACRWYDEFDSDETPEDVLSQAHLLLDK